MYSGVKSRVKYCKQLGDSFTCMLGVQVECLPQFLFAMFLNDVENVFLEQEMNGIDVKSFKLFLILYADDMVFFANNAAELQTSLDFMYEYCNHWKLIVNIDKTKVVIFRKGGRIPNDIDFFRSTQNEFVYGELGRIDFQCMRYCNIIR